MFDGGIAAAAIAAVGDAKKKPSPKPSIGIVPGGLFGAGPRRSASIASGAALMLQDTLINWIEEVFGKARKGKSIAFYPRIELLMHEEHDILRRQEKLAVRMNVRLVLTDGTVILPKDANQFDLVHLREPDEPLPFTHIEREMKNALIEALPKFREAFNKHKMLGKAKAKIKVDELYGYAPAGPSYPSYMTLPGIPSRSEYEKLVAETKAMKQQLDLEKWANDRRTKGPPTLAWDPAKDGTP